MMKDLAICISCGKLKEVCCDYKTKSDGTHIDPICVDCCSCRKYSAYKHIWDGKVSGSGIYQRGE